MTETAFHPITVTIAKTQITPNAVEDTGKRDLHGLLVGVHSGAATWKAGFSRKLRKEMPYNPAKPLLIYDKRALCKHTTEIHVYLWLLQH